MDGIGRALGSGTTMKILTKEAEYETHVETVNGEPQEVRIETAPAEYKTYVIAPIDLDAFGLIEQHLLGMKQAPETVLGKMLEHVKSPVQQEMLLKIAYEDMRKGYNKCTAAEIAQYVDTPDGMLFTFWVSIRVNHPEFDTLEKAKEVFDKMNEQEQAEFIRRRNLASGVDILGNSTGRTDKRSSANGSSGPAPKRIAPANGNGTGRKLRLTSRSPGDRS